MKRLMTLLLALTLPAVLFSTVQPAAASWAGRNLDLMAWSKLSSCSNHLSAPASVQNDRISAGATRTIIDGTHPQKDAINDRDYRARGGALI